MLRYAPLIALSPTLFPTSTTFYRTNQCTGTWEDTSRCHPHANGCGNPYICTDEVSKGLSPFLIFYSLPSPLPDTDMAGPLHRTIKRHANVTRCVWCAHEAPEGGEGMSRPRFSFLILTTFYTYFALTTAFLHMFSALQGGSSGIGGGRRLSLRV